MGHAHLHRRGERAPLMEREEVHKHDARSPQFWEDVGDAWNRFIGKDEEDDEPTTTARRSTAPATIVRTVYQTLTPTFSGSVGGYRTVSDSDDEDDKPTSTKKAPQTTTFAAGGPLLGSAKPTTTAEEETTEKIPSVISEPTKSKIESTLAVATSTPSAVLDSTGAINADRVDASISSASSTSVATTESAETGPSTGAKAGIAIGVLAGFLFIGLLAFWLFNRRKKQMEQDQNARDDEKLNPFGNPPLVAAAAVPSSSSQRSGPAPRLSLRPVTQFLPNLSLDKRTSKGAQVMLASAPAGGDDRLGPNHARNSWERPNTSDSTNPSNPFGNQAERIPTPIMEEPESPHYPSEKPLPAGPTTMAAVPTANSPPAHDANGMGMAVSVAAGAAAGAVAAGALTRKASIRQDGAPKPLDLTLPPPPTVGGMAVPPSPAGTEFSETSQAGEQPAPSSAGAAAIAAAGGPANSMVHRVQLDFKPTMDDELELRAGQLVRLLHEYDDGWALCIRLDRSQQGVVPRTCLSTRPVKPRPQNGPGPNGPGPNGPSPNGPGPRNHPGRPNGPGGPGGPPRGPGPKFGPGQRPPQGGPHGGPNGGPRGGPQYARGPDPMMHGRPASPGGRAMSPGPRSQSPGPRFQGPPGGRPQSPSGMGPRSQSPGPRFQGPPGGRARSPSMGPRSQSPAGQSRIPQPTRMGPGGSPPQGSPISPINGRNRAFSNASNASGPPTGPVTRKPVPGSAY